MLPWTFFIWDTYWPNRLFEGKATLDFHKCKIIRCRHYWFVKRRMYQHIFNLFRLRLFPPFCCGKGYLVGGLAGTNYEYHICFTDWPIFTIETMGRCQNKFWTQYWAWTVEFCTITAIVFWKNNSNTPRILEKNNVSWTSLTSEINAFSTYSWRFLRSNKLEQLEFKLEKIIGI